MFTHPLFQASLTQYCTLLVISGTYESSFCMFWGLELLWADILSYGHYICIPISEAYFIIRLDIFYFFKRFLSKVRLQILNIVLIFCNCRTGNLILHLYHAVENKMAFLKCLSWLFFVSFLSLLRCWVLPATTYTCHCKGLINAVLRWHYRRKLTYTLVLYNRASKHKDKSNLSGKELEWETRHTVVQYSGTVQDHFLQLCVSSGTLSP